MLALLVPTVVVGAVVWLAASRWPQAVEAPSVSATEMAKVPEHRGVLSGLVRRRVDPAELTGLALTVALAVLALGLLGVGLLLRMVRTDSGFARWDLAFTRFGAEHATGWTTDVLRTVSRLGGYELVIVLAVVVALVELRRTRRVSVVAFLAVVVAGQFAVAELVKHVVDRARPDLLNLTGFSGTSFPSGHATAAAATFMAFALVLGLGRRARTRAALAGIAAGIAAAVAATRVLLGVHWFTDVLAGLLLGWAWFALCSIAFGGVLLRFGAPVVQAESALDRDGPEHRTSGGGAVVQR